MRNILVLQRLHNKHFVSFNGKGGSCGERYRNLENDISWLNFVRKIIKLFAWKQHAMRNKQLWSCFDSKLKTVGVLKEFWIENNRFNTFVFDGLKITCVDYKKISTIIIIFNTLRCKCRVYILKLGKCYLIICSGVDI